MSGKAKHMQRSHRSYQQKLKTIGSIDYSTKRGQEGKKYAAEHKGLGLKEMFKAMFRKGDK